MTSLPLFPASIVGSIPRPLMVRELIEKPEWDEADSRAMDAAVRYVVALQEKAGLDVVNDGEWRRRSYIGVIAELAHGFTLETNPADGRPWTVVTERLSPKPPGFVADEARFVKSIAKAATKITLPAPALLGERLWDSGRSGKAYPDRDDFVRDCVAPLRAEIALMRDMGIDIVQIDDPHLCLFVDPDVRRRYADPDRAADFAVDMINAVVDGFTGIKFAVHLCRRAGARVRGEKHHAGTYGPILPQLNRLNVAHLTMEFTAGGADDLESLSRLRGDFELGLGVVDVTPGAPEHARLIVSRVERALTRVDAKRITLNPDCGFAPGSAAKVDIDEVYLKLKAEAEAAATLRARHG
ncbi:MAG: cobalamin-independent methionine synthase II family protein [Rhodospirillales bacterium]|nr:MAG: cobalamin-independent methionine synthase II family protein [Rhodospirillales bacterium]